MATRFFQGFRTPATFSVQKGPLSPFAKEVASLLLAKKNTLSRHQLSIRRDLERSGQFAAMRLPDNVTEESILAGDLDFVKLLFAPAKKTPRRPRNTSSTTATKSVKAVQGIGATGGDDDDTNNSNVGELSIQMMLKRLDEPGGFRNIFPKRGNSLKNTLGSTASSWLEEEVNILKVDTRAAASFPFANEPDTLLNATYDALLQGAGPDAVKPEDYLQQYNTAIASTPAWSRDVHAVLHNLAVICIDVLRKGGDPSWSDDETHKDACLATANRYPVDLTEQQSQSGKLVRVFARDLFQAIGLMSEGVRIEEVASSMGGILRVDVAERRLFAFSAQSDFLFYKHQTEAHDLLVKELRPFSIAAVVAEMKSVTAGYHTWKFGCRSGAAQAIGEALVWAEHNMRHRSRTSKKQAEQMPVLHLSGYYANWVFAEFSDRYLTRLLTQPENEAVANLWPPSSVPMTSAPEPAADTKSGVDKVLRHKPLVDFKMPGHNLLSHAGRQALIHELGLLHAHSARMED
eukprot:TRINITY_DN6771_c0_g1_i1.p1 TRINITY_DN6771_c0_g1~~TRINITY_DN6771_c0_g1_i1.p1  ORF type:complete len:517 (+),score=82.61 TRINITY_DN6771_c0_g1_i1:183-1733(+)